MRTSKPTLADWLFALHETRARRPSRGGRRDVKAYLSDQRSRGVTVRVLKVGKSRSDESSTERRIGLLIAI